MRKPRNLKKKACALLLAAAMSVTAFPQLGTTVYAAEPDAAQFATAEQLKTYNTATAGASAKVYFGKDNQQWWIAGVDEKIKDEKGSNIVLFAASPLATRVKFNAYTSSTSKTYNESWRCAYPNGSTINTVNVNHYGGSDIRNGNKTVDPENPGLVGLLESCFTEAERGLMNATTVYTQDTANTNTSNQPLKYSTKDKLYLAYSAGTGETYKHVTVGANSAAGLDSGLQVDKTYWGGSRFWLRAPDDNRGDNALVAAPDITFVISSDVGNDYSVVPAFNLNLTDVLFASSAPTAEAGAKNLSGNDTMTFRWADKEGNDAKIKSTATWNEDGVNVTKGSESADVYLCVQGKNGKDWIWSKKVNDVTSPITADTIASALTGSNVFTDTPAVDLTQCKIWLETTVENDGLTYAKQAKKLAKEPDTKTQFVEVEQLMKFDTDDSDNKPNPAKVYFGENNQRWWIAGVDEKIKDEKGSNIVLFAASPLASGIRFNAIGSGGTYDGYNVNPNHYGASPLRKTTLKNLETDYFTSEEQKLMNTTTVSTKNTGSEGPRSYSTKDKLYLAYGNLIDTFVTVGTNSADDLNNGLHVDEGYWGDDYFWLRAPYGHDGIDALVADPRNCVGSNYVDAYDSVVLPAFDLNLTSVIFASAAPAATGEGGPLDTKDVTNNGAFTLRYKSDSIGTATLSTDKKSVSISGVNNDNTYLVAQNSEGAQAKKVKNGNVSIEDMYPDLATFENCQIWLETTTGGLTYAKQAQTGTDGQSQGSNSNKGGQNNGNKGVNTGDESSPALWIALMLLAIAGAGGTALYSRKKKAVK